MSLNNFRIIFNHNIGFVINKIISKLFLLFEIRRFARCGKNISIVAPFRIIGHKYMKIGDNFSAGVNLWIEAVTRHGTDLFSPRIVIKDDVSVNDFVHIGATTFIEIGNNVLMGSKVFIADNNHGQYSGPNQSSPYTPPNNRSLTRDSHVVIKDNVWIGENVSIMPGVTIGQGSIIGANSVVTKDVPAFSMAVGCPARVIKKYDEGLSSWVPVV